MSINTPSPDAFEFSLTGGNNKQYQVAIFANQIFATEVGMRTVFRAQGDTEWNYVIEPSIYKENAETDDMLLDAVRAALIQITKKIREFFLLNDDEPTEPPKELVERVAAIIKTQLVWDSQQNELSLK